MRIEAADETTAKQYITRLRDLLINAVDSGASIGWVSSVSASDAEAYWRDRIDAVAAGCCVLLLAWEDDVLVGTAQLGLEQRENGLHRAEVQKVMVHTDYRRRGIANQLMAALETQAIHHHRTLLVLDTRQGDASEELYRKLGYVEAGAIPQYCRSANGQLDPTVLYYKLL